MVANHVQIVDPVLVVPHVFLQGERVQPPGATRQALGLGMFPMEKFAETGLDNRKAQ